MTHILPQRMLLETVGKKTLAEVEKKLLIPGFKLDPLADGDKEQDPRDNRRWHPGMITDRVFCFKELMHNSHTEYFHNFPNSGTAHTSILDAVLRTSAAPSYFPIYQGIRTHHLSLFSEQLQVFLIDRKQVMWMEEHLQTIQLWLQSRPQ